jgi:hypothetical protein
MEMRSETCSPVLGTPRWWNGWITSRWPSRRSAPARSTPPLSSRGRRTTFRYIHIMNNLCQYSEMTIQKVYCMPARTTLRSIKNKIKELEWTLAVYSKFK